MAFVVPNATDFKAHFTRDFPYGTQNNTVLDSDINKAIAEAGLNFNEALFSDQNSYSIAYLYLSAHYLVMDLRASTQGIAGDFPWLSNSKSVGSVSEGLAIPEFMLLNPMLSHFGKTYYGVKYLSIIFPRIVGPVLSTPGATKP